MSLAKCCGTCRFFNQLNEEIGFCLEKKYVFESFLVSNLELCESYDLKEFPADTNKDDCENIFNVDGLRVCSFCGESMQLHPCDKFCKNNEYYKKMRYLNDNR